MVQEKRVSRIACATAILGAAGLSGCAAVDANVNHSQLVINNHISETVFLDPVPPEKRSIYITARNTSDHPELDLKAPLVAAIAQRGYLVVQDPAKAQFMLRMNILQAGEVDAKSKGALLAANYGEPLLGGVAAAGIASAAGANGLQTSAVGLGIAAATFVANQAYQQKTYSVVVDIELASRPLSGAKVQQNTSSVAANSNSTSQHQYTGTPTGAGMQSGMHTATNTYNGRNVSQSINEEQDFKKYQIRDVVYADQVNLKFENAVQPLEVKMTSALSNLFEEGVAPTQAQVDQAFAVAAVPQPVAVEPKPKTKTTRPVVKAPSAGSGAQATNLDDATPPPPPRN